MKNIALLFFIFVFSSGVSAQSNSIKIFLGNSVQNPNSEDCGKVFAVKRQIPRTRAVARAALDELLKGVTETEKAQNYYSTFPEESRSVLKKLNVKKGAAYIDFRANVEEVLNGASSSCGSETFFAQIENTLKQFPSIKKVFYAIEGKPADFYDWMQIGECPKELKNCRGTDFK